MKEIFNHASAHYPYHGDESKEWEILRSPDFWKSYTAQQIEKIIGQTRCGVLWHPEHAAASPIPVNGGEYSADLRGCHVYR